MWVEKKKWLPKQMHKSSPNHLFVDAGLIAVYLKFYLLYCQSMFWENRQNLY